jgi:methionyl-tRNA formyltransferase
MRLVYFGSGQFAVRILQSVLGAGHEVAAVITQPDRPAGRGRKLRPTPVRDLAQERGLPVIAVEKVNDPAITAQILGLGARIGVVAAFGQKIGKALLEGFPAGLINAHASLLPKYRGAAPINWALINAEDETGVTVFRLVERMDAGAVFLKRRTFIKPGETTEDLESRLSGIACDAVTSAMELFKDTDNPPMEAQDESKATRAPKLSRRDGFVDFAEPAWKAARRVCGLWPWPGAACDFRKAEGVRRERVVFARAYVIRNDDAADRPPAGTILPDLSIQTGQGAIRVTQIKPANGKLMRLEDFVRGRRLAPGDRFETLTPDMLAPTQQEAGNVRTEG